MTEQESKAVVVRTRCCWCNVKNPLYVAYHDTEWGRLDLNDQHLYEMLILESFQAGLSWECILNKREGFRQAFDQFDLDKICAYESEKIEELMQNKNIVRNRRKITATISNSKIFRKIVNEYGSFQAYLTSFTHGEIFYETDCITNALSDAISGDLEKRGMKFVGSVIIYSYLQAVGIIVSHEKGCYLHTNLT